ncbi:hypothetical protein OAD33_08515 [Alphaproteobacteria bacterium]|nr:hypothetical protein [Alphaproteobacteria bacterium]
MVNIDSVYQKVLALANKEQRGYITPQEFNLFANHAQMDIFEQYFYDLNQFDRSKENDLEYSGMMNVLEEKISVFEKFKVAMLAMSGNQATLPTDLYRLGTVFYGAAGYDVEVEKVGKKELEYMLRTSLAAPVDARPVYVRKSDTLLKIFPASPSTSYSTSNITCNYIKKPTKVVWTYNVVAGNALYNSTAADAQNFELHASEETELVYKILELAGVTLNKPGLVQLAGTEDMQKQQQEKQ